MRLSSFAFAAALSFATPLAAQDAEALSREYVSLPAVQNMMSDMFAPEALAAQMMSTFPPDVAVETELVTKISTALSEWMRAQIPAMNEIMIDASAEIFTAEELEAMIAFYSSGPGASAMAKTPQFMEAMSFSMNQLMMNPETGIMSVLTDVLEE